MEQEIKENSESIKDAGRGLLWFSRLTKYIDLLVKIQEKLSDRLTEEVQIRLTGTKKGYAVAIGRVQRSQRVHNTTVPVTKPPR